MLNEKNNSFELACYNENIDLVVSMIKKEKEEHAYYVFCLIQKAFIIASKNSKGADNMNHGLYGSCRKGDMDMINLMIDKGANYWNLGLQGACKGGHMNIVLLMIEKGANDWNGGLISACKGGHINIVLFMIEKGANDIYSAFYCACIRGHIDIIQFLFTYGADEWIIFGLETACRGEQIHVVKFMIKKGVRHLNHALNIAYKTGNDEIIQYLLENGAIYNSEHD